jgi:putative ABC transport system permease protein
MQLLRQIGAVTAMNLRSLPQRAATSLVIVIGIAGVVAVMTSVLAMSTGMIRTMDNAGRDDRVIVMRNGSSSEAASSVSRDWARLIADAPGVKRGADGNPIMSAEALSLVSLFRKEDGTEVNVILRGVGPKLHELRPEIHITSGRMFRPAVTEVIIGRSAAGQYRGVSIGDKVRTRNATWTIVGTFATGGDSRESEIMTDADTLISSNHRAGFQSITAMLESPGTFQRFKDAITSNPALAVDVMREPEYFKHASEQISRVISFLAYVVGGIMAVGAVFGALNTMYSAVSERLREIATLRALGFGATAMIVSVLAEALLLAALGGVIGSVLAWLFFNGNTVSTGGTARGQLIFDLSVSPQLMIAGIVWACVIGLIGGLFPAIRAARLPVAEALRAV